MLKHSGDMSTDVMTGVMTADVIPSPAEARMLTVVVRFSGHVNGNLAGKLKEERSEGGRRRGGKQTAVAVLMV